MCVCVRACVGACVCAEGHEHEDTNLSTACSVFAGHFGVIEKELVP